MKNEIIEYVSSKINVSIPNETINSLVDVYTNKDNPFKRITVYYVDNIYKNIDFITVNFSESDYVEVWFYNNTIQKTNIRIGNNAKTLGEINKFLKGLYLFVEMLENKQVFLDILDFETSLQA